MTTDSSATALQDTPHETETTTIRNSDAVRCRAHSVINDITIDPEWRTILRYALELDDPWLPELMRRAEAGENILDTFESLRTPETDDDSTEDDSTEGKVKALTEIICRAGSEAAAALFVLMGTLENSRDPETHTHVSKHVAFNRCADLNLYGMIDTQLVAVENELLERSSLTP
jgi:hypothetical protein